MPKQLNVNLAFTADTGKAAAQIKSLQDQLNQLMRTGIGDSKSLGLTKEIQEANTAVMQLKTSLQSATTSTGTLDLTKFNDSLKASGMSLEQYRTKLSALGPEGTAAFSQLASSIASAEIPIRRANGLLKELGTSLANTARWQLSSSLLHGFIGSLQSAFGYAQDLNESLNNIRIVTSQSTDQMAALAQKANQAAKELGTRTTDYTNAALIYYQQGLDDKAVEERTRTTLKLANVTRQSAEEVSSQMTAIWNNFDDGTKKLEYYADAITALGAKTASSSSEIAQGLSKFAAVADTIGLSYETASAAIATVVAETRQSADTVGNAFKSIFSRLQSLKLGETLEDGVGLTKYSEALEKVGVKVLDINGELREADEIMSDLGNRWTEISDTQKTALAQTVAGQRQYAQFVALFDNWDKVQENMNIAADSEGELQKQQEIYAEGWEDAKERVRASAEAIYNALINDKFFIGFDNLLSKILDGINNFISSLGGLKGVLSTVGTLVTQIFNQKIAANIDRIGKNMKSFFTRGSEEKALQSQSIDLLKKAASEQSNNLIGQTQKTGLEAQAALQQKLYENQSYYNEEQTKTAQLLLDQNKTLSEQANLSARVAETERIKADAAEKNFIEKYATQANTWGQQFQVEDYVTKLRLCIEQQNVIRSNAQTLEGILGSAFTDPGQKVELFRDQIDSLKGGLEQLKTNFSGELLGNLANELLGMINSFQGTDAEMQAIVNKLNILKQTSVDTGFTLQTSLEEELKQFLPAGTNVEAVVNKMIAAFEKYGVALADVGEKTTAMKSQAESAKTTLDGFKNTTLDFGRIITGVSSFAMSFASVINSVKGAIDTLNNEDLSFGEKLLAIIPSLLMSFSMLTNSILGSGGAAVVAVAQHLPVIGTFMAEAASAKAAAGSVGSLGIAFKAAFPELLLFTAAAAAIIGIIYGISTALKDAQKNSVENLLKEAQEESQKAKDALEEAKTAAEDLQTAFDNYKSIREQLDNCTEGTDEWKEALEKVNEEVLNIIENYPELAKYLSTDENGALTLDEEGFKDLLNQTNNNKYARYGEYFQASANELYAEQRVAEKNVTDAALRAHIQNVFGANDNYLDESQINSVFSSMADRFIELLDSGIEGASFDPGHYIDLMLKDIANQYKESIMTNRGIGSAEFDELLASQHVQMRDDGKLNIPKELNQMILDSGQVDQSWINNQVQTLKGLLEDAFEDEELIQALYDYKDAIKTTTETQEKYALAMGEMILKENEEFMKQDNASDFFRAGGDLYNILLKKYQQEMEKQSDEDLLDYYSKHTGIKELEGKTSFNDTDENGKEAIKYEDSSGEQIITREDVINYQAASQAAYDLAGEMTSLTQKTNELAESESKSDNALGDILKRQAISNNGKDLREAIDNAQLKDNGEYKGTFSGAEKQIAIYLDKMLGDGLDGILSESTLNKYGFKTMSDIVNAVIEGMQEVDNRIEQARDLGDKTLNQIMEKMINKNLNFEDLDIDEQEQAKQLLLDSIHSLGAQGFDAMIDLFTKSGEHIGQVIETLSNEDINWATVGTEELAEKISELGIDSEISKESLDSILKVLKDLGAIDLESATQQYKDLHDIVKDVSEDSFIDAEQLKTLKDFDIDVDKFFTPMADGTYKLIGDAQEFYDAVNNASIEGFKQGIEQELGKKETLEGLKSSYESEDNKAKDNLLESARMEKGFNKEQVKNQLEYLNALNLTGEAQEKLTAIEEDYTHNKGDTIRMTSTHLDQLQELIDLYKGEWERMLEEGFDETEIDNYTKAMISSLSTLEDVRTVLGDITNKETGEPLFTEEQIQAYEKFFKDYLFDPSNIKTFNDFKEDLGGLLTTPKEIKAAWEQLNLAELTKEQFDEVKGVLDSSDIINSIKALYENGEITKDEALNELVQQIKDGAVEAEDALPYYKELTQIDDETTAQTLARIGEEIKLNIANADELETAISKIANNKRMSDEEKLTANKEIRAGAMTSHEIGKEKKEEIIDETTSTDFQTILSMGKSVNETIDLVSQLKTEYINTLKAIGSQPAPDVLKEMNDQLVNLILNSEDLDVAEKLEKIKEVLGEDLPDDVISKMFEILSDKSIDTEEQIKRIQALLNDDSDLVNVSDLISEILGNSDTTTIEKMHQLLELAKQYGNSQDLSEQTGQFLAKNVTDVSQAEEVVASQNFSIGYAQQQADALEKPEAPTINSAADYAQHTEDLIAYNEALNAYNEALAGVNEMQQMAKDSLQEWANNLDGANFDSLKDLMEVQKFLIDNGAQLNSAMVTDNIIEYASQFDRCKEAIHEYNMNLMEGKDATDAFNAIITGAQIEDWAKAFDLDADNLSDIIDYFKELKPELAEYPNLINTMALEQARYNSAMEDIESAGEDYVNVLQKINGEGEQSVLFNSKLSKTYNSMVKTLSNLTNTNEKVAKSLIKNKDLSEDLQNALTGDVDAIKTVTTEARKMGLIEIGFDDSKVEGGIDSVLDHLNELPEGKEIELNANAEGFDGVVSDVIGQMATLEREAGGNIDTLQTKLSELANLDVEFELVSPQQAETLARQGEQIVAIAANTADAAYSAMEGGTEATVTTETTETSDEVQLPPDQIADVDQVEAQISSLSGGGGSAAEGGSGLIPIVEERLDLTYPSVTYSSNNAGDSEDVEKSDSVNLYHVKKATPGNEGRTTHQNNTTSGGGGCFIAGTLISTNQGFKNIEDIKVNDIVLSYNFKTGQNEYSKVLQTMIHDIQDNIYSIYIEDDIIQSTAIHKFLIMRNNKVEWIAASDLKINDLTLFADGTLHRISQINIKKQTITVYNFEVSNNHNYYVGQNRILVHNKGGCFVAGTLVMTNHGFKNIEDIQQGDIVLSYNENYNYNEYSMVLQTMIHVVYENIYTLYTENEQLTVTGIHRFLITRNGVRGWIHAENLQVGDLMQYADGSLHEIKQINVKVDLRTVYNFEVSGNHNYYVGYNGILAHNKGRGGGGRGGRGRTRRSTYTRSPRTSMGIRTAVEKIDNKAEKNTESLESATENLNKELEKTSKLKSRAYGEDKIALLEKEKEIIDKLIAEQKKYQEALKQSIADLKKLMQVDNQSKADAYNKQVEKIRAIEERIKKKESEGKNTSKDYAELQTEKEKLNGMDTSDLYEADYEDGYSVMVTYNPKVNFGIDPVINDKGEIINKDEIDAKIESLSKKKNAEWDIRQTQINQKKNEKQKAKLQRMLNRDKAEWEGQIKAWEEMKAAYEGKAEAYEKSVEKVEDYEQDKEDIDYDIEDIRNDLNKKDDKNEDTETELEKIQYSIELKINIQEDKLNLLEFLFDKLGNKAETATTRIGLLGKELETTAKKQKIYEEGIARILDIHGGAGSSAGNIMSKMQSQYQNTMFGRADFGNLSAEKLQSMQQRWGRSFYQPNQQQTQSQHWSGTEAVEAMKQGNQEVVEALKNKKQWYKEEAEQMQEYAKSLLDTAQNMRELKDQAIQMIGEVFDELQDRMDESIDNHSQLQNKLQHYQRMMELVGRSIYGGNKKVMDQMAKDQLTLAENNLKMVRKQMETTQSMLAETEAKRKNAEKEYQKELAAGNQAAADEWQHNMDLMDEDLKNMREKDKELVQAYWKAEEEAAEAATTKYENMVKNSIQEFTDTLAKGFQSFEALQTAFDRQRNTNKTYVEDYEKVYKLSKMTREIEQQIAKIDNLKSKEAYLKLQNEINKASEKGVRLSQYDLDLMQKKFDVLKAQAEFEESQSNKTQVSLTRDNEGNYGYVYTANEEDVQKAEQTYSDKIYEMRKLNANYINDLQSQLLQLNTNMINDIQKLKDTLGEDNDTYQSELQRIKENYAQQQEALTQQLTKALNDSNEINTSYLQEYASLTGDRLALEADYVSTWQDTVLGQLLDGYSTLADYQRAWTENTKDLFDDVAQASRDWRDDNRDVLEIAGDDFKEYVDSMGNEQDIMVENSAQMVDAFELQTDMIRDLFSGTIDAAENLMGAWTSIVGQMLSDAAQLEAAFLDVMEAWGDLVSQSNASSSSDDSSSSSSTSTTSANGTKPEETKKNQGIDDQAADRSERIVWLDESDRVDNKKKKNKKKTKTGIKKKIKTENKPKTKTNKNTGKKKKKKKKGAATYATGGYTGEWGASGKLAVLHEKELVLNEEDTENLLDSVEIVRDISKVIDINAMVAQNGSGFGIGSYFNSRGNTATIQQQITINADFPNVTSRDEIKSAFDNMVGLASQYANRRFFK